MSKSPIDKPAAKPDKKNRLSEALRANLKRRKNIGKVPPKEKENKHG